MKKRAKLCLVSSAGGHLTQLLALLDCWSGYDPVWITTSEVVRGKIEKYGKVYVTGECNRQHLFKVLKVFCHCSWIILQQRPAVVISTGAAVGCISCFLAKLIGAKIVWIDSITNVEKISLSGRMVRFIADLFLVQWPQLTGKYSKTEYAGALV